MKVLLFRGVGALLLGGAGFGLGWLATAGESGSTKPAILAVLLVVGAILGAGIFPIIFLAPVERMRRYLRRLSLPQVGLATLGLTSGLIVSVLLVPALSRLPDPADWIAPLVTAFVAGGGGLLLFAGRAEELTALLRQPAEERRERLRAARAGATGSASSSTRAPSSTAASPTSRKPASSRGRSSCRASFSTSCATSPTRRTRFDAIGGVAASMC